MSKYTAEQVNGVADNIVTQEIVAKQMLRAYAATLSQQAEWPSDADVVRAWGVLCESKEIADATMGDKNMLPHMRAALQSVRPPAGVVSDEVTVEVVGRVERDGTGELDINWSVEGGIHAVEEGSYLYCTDRDDFMPDDGVVTLFASSHARQVPDEFIEDIQRAERLSVKSKKLSRERMMGLAVIKHLGHWIFAAPPAPEKD